RDTFELDVGARAQRVADAKNAGIPEAEDVSRERLFDLGALLGKELKRAAQNEGLFGANVLDGHAAHEAPRADAGEGDAVPMLLVHVRLDLEDEGGEVGRARSHQGARRRARQRRGSEVDEAIEKRL